MNLQTLQAAVTHVLIRGDEWRPVRWERDGGQWRSSFEVEERVVIFRGRWFSGDEPSLFVTRTDEIVAVRVHSDPERYVPVPSDFDHDAGKFVFSPRRD